MQGKEPELMNLSWRNILHNYLPPDLEKNPHRCRGAPVTTASVMIREPARATKLDPAIQEFIRGLSLRFPDIEQEITSSSWEACGRLDNYHLSTTS